jgi:pimeloyl-ACP methyl ester carboxylesterase/membrane protein DedA with SNARE-associated domain
MESRLTVRKKYLLIIYFSLLLLSHLVRAFHTEKPLSSDMQAVEVKAFAGERQTDKAVRLAYRQFNAGQQSSVSPSISTDTRPVVILLHGSPGNSRDFNSLAPHLAKQYRVIRPDLPGFGESTHRLPDYSVRAHAHYVLALMDSLHIERAHVIAFSMGGGVGLEMADLAPERISSLTMLSAIGVQEMELLGDYHLNHAVHGIQLVGLWLMREVLPHFGYLDDAILGVEYARNFYDTDQRRLREILTHYESPMLILHGEKDVLVPVEAAREHYRLVPQSEAHYFPSENHFTVFTQGAMLADLILPFLGRVDQVKATTRAQASPDRLARAAEAFNPAVLPKAQGVTLLVMILLLAAATLVSEDLTCISAGLMVAQGRMSFLAASIACFIGIFIGDVLLFLAGRFFGRPALTHAPLKWFMNPKDVDRSSRWFNRNGLAVIATSRFVPGARLPTYFAAGLLHTNFWWFCLYFLLAGVVWSPLLIGLSAALGAEVLHSFLISNQTSFFKILGFALLLLILLRFTVRLTTYRGRRLLVGWWRRKIKWEFWKMWAFYPPVVAYIIFLMAKHRSLTLFTASNPAIPGGGFVGESKAEILQALADADGFIARHRLLPARLDVNEQFARAKTFMRDHGLDFPVILKPDLGQRGSGVAVVRSDEALHAYLCETAGDIIVQEYVAGDEFGIFYYRYPNSEQGTIFSITEKRFPVVNGDGKSTLERLILADQRAVCMAKFYFDKQSENLEEVLQPGEARQLVELGTHCRGAIFLDGMWVKTEALEAAIDRISKKFAGFYFGRYDIRVPSIEDFKRGENFKVIELNGVTSEATHIYDPKNHLIDAYRVLFEQWRIAFAIGAQNRDRGAHPSSLRELIRAVREFRERSANQ